MDSFLTAKTAGLPRWAWLALAGGGLAIGLYLRHKHHETEEPEAEEEQPVASENSLESYNGTEAAGGLAAAGLVGPAQGQITPVQAPYLPEGFTDLLNSEGETIGALASREPAPAGERVEVEREGEGPIAQAIAARFLTGGGPSNRKPHHKAPPKTHHGRKHTPKHRNPSGKPPRRRALSGATPAR